jgi:hypothetical protein
MVFDRQDLDELFDKFKHEAAGRADSAANDTIPSQTSCRPIMIAEDPHRSAIYEQKFTFN